MLTLHRWFVKTAQAVRVFPTMFMVKYNHCNFLAAIFTIVALNFVIMNELFRERMDGCKSLLWRYMQSRHQYGWCDSTNRRNSILIKKSFWSPQHFDKLILTKLYGRQDSSVAAAFAKFCSDIIKSYLVTVNKIFIEYEIRCENRLESYVVTAKSCKILRIKDILCRGTIGIYSISYARFDMPT